MKPHQKNRSRSYFRHHRKRVIQRKTKIAKLLLLSKNNQKLTVLPVQN